MKMGDNGYSYLVHIRKKSLLVGRYCTMNNVMRQS
uniref:Uncharacterized protein n=1 Tax=Arundo donax TaxID=35708 RepID=A0A0A9ABY4_ARUDO